MTDSGHYFLVCYVSEYVGLVSEAWHDVPGPLPGVGRRAGGTRRFCTWGTGTEPGQHHPTILRPLFLVRHVYIRRPLPYCYVSGLSSCPGTPYVAEVPQSTISIRNTCKHWLLSKSLLTKLRCKATTRFPAGWAYQICKDLSTWGEPNHIPNDSPPSCYATQWYHPLYKRPKPVYTASFNAISKSVVSHIQAIMCL